MFYKKIAGIENMQVFYFGAAIDNIFRDFIFTRTKDYLP